MKIFQLSDIQFTNDIIKSDKKAVLKKIQGNAIFSFSFLALLISSSLVCTLGLLLNSAPVVIGGMIISPLMWPLLKTSVGISTENPKIIRQAIILLIIAIVVTMLVAAVITWLSPIKNLTTQILARTTPTLLDLIIALAAGAIAGLGITQPKISESLAGVAIATSLMPPLCVSGIGLALLDWETLIGGFLLFFTNAVAIMFVAVLVFSYIGIKRKTNAALRRKGAYILVAIILVTAIPLYFYLRTYSLRTSSYQIAKDVLQAELSQVSSSIVVTNISTDFTGGNDEAMTVQAQLLLPEDIAIDYSQQQKIISQLEHSFQKKVNLKLMLQRTIAILSEEDIHNANTKKVLQKIFTADLSKRYPNLAIDSILIERMGSTWQIHAVLRGNPNTLLTESDRAAIQKNMTSEGRSSVALSLQLVPVVNLVSNASLENSVIEEEVSTYITEVFSDPNITSSITVIKNNTVSKQLEIQIDMSVPFDAQITDEMFITLKDQLETTYEKKPTLHIHIIREEMKQF